MIAAPMPGLEPQDISITIAGDRVGIRGEERGPRQHAIEVIMEEWRTGPYFREVVLPQKVNCPLSNATYGNGVLVLSIREALRAHLASGLTGLGRNKAGASTMKVPLEVTFRNVPKTEAVERLIHSRATDEP